jgi:hypothetical protein
MGDFYTGRCKKCGSVKLDAYDTVISTVSIVGFERMEIGGYVGMVPTYGEDSETWWDTSQPYDKAKPYQCDDCGELLGDDDIEFFEEKEEVE